MRRPCGPLAAAIVLLAGSPLRADEVRIPRYEVGGTVSGITPIAADGPVIVLGAGPRVTFNLTPRFGLELLAEAVGPVESSGTTGLYQVQLKIPLSGSRTGKRTLSITIGAAGTASYQHTRETRISRPDGSTVVYPESRRFRAAAPMTFVIGVSRDQVFHRFASSHLALQGYVGAMGGVAVRASLGVSFGIGGYR